MTKFFELIPNIFPITLIIWIIIMVHKLYCIALLIYYSNYRLRISRAAAGLLISQLELDYVQYSYNGLSVRESSRLVSRMILPSHVWEDAGSNRFLFGHSTPHDDVGCTTARFIQEFRMRQLGRIWKQYKTRMAFHGGLQTYVRHRKTVSNFLRFLSQVPANKFQLLLILISLTISERADIPKNFFLNYVKTFGTHLAIMTGSSMIKKCLHFRNLSDESILTKTFDKRTPFSPFRFSLTNLHRFSIFAVNVIINLIFHETTVSNPSGQA
ncbi:hypothetical protein L9F63_001139, partial [Diploptera punctata]